MLNVMTAVQKSLAYDAGVIAATLVFAFLTNGFLQDAAVVIAAATFLKAPYDVWMARRTGSE